MIDSKSLTSEAVCFSALSLSTQAAQRIVQLIKEGIIATPSEMLVLAESEPPELAWTREVCQPNRLAKARSEILRLRDCGVSLLTFSDSTYPSLLREIYDPPLALFAKGDVPEDFGSRTFIGVVGSRNSDTTGGETAHKLGSVLATAGAVVVSGLASGIDAMAHRGALDSGAPCSTVAILGNGITRTYPTANTVLSRKIETNGGILLSQFLPDEKPFPSNFLNRNRIIAGMSKGVAVVQAAARSGSLVTARYALEEGRDVFAVPGGVNDPRHAGTNAIIRQGATLVRTPEDLMEYYPEFAPFLSDRRTRRLPSLRPDERRIMEILKSEPTVHLETVSKQYGDTGNFMEVLLDLELQGFIRRLPGNQVALVQ